MATVQLERNEEEDTMYMCKCCRSLYSREEYPPIAGMCPECHKSKEEALIALYNDVERALSHMISTAKPFINPLDLIKIRDNLRAIMRTMGWQGPF